MRLIDSHCHLTHGKLLQQVGEVLVRAAAAGVETVICAVGDVHETKAALGLAGQHAGVRCLAGIHPHDARDATAEALRQIEQLAGRNEVVAVGEIGLDYHYDYSPRDDQRRAFAAQLDLAGRVGRPVVIHTREAFEDTMAILGESGLDAARAVFHSFTGPPEQARAVLDVGAAVSFSGIATFKKAGDIRRSAAIVPDDRILIETDAPFLSPEPVRSMKVNEPANVAHVAACLAEVRGAAPDAFAERTTENAIRFFALEERLLGAR